MPKIFTIIDSEMKRFFSGRRLEKFALGCPRGIVEYGDKWVESQPISLPNTSSTCFIKGKVDTIVKLDDGGYGVIDFKTSQRNSKHIPLYARQLHAYAYALENPAPGKLCLKPITRLGLLVYEPEEFVTGEFNSAALNGGLAWIEINRNDDEFTQFLTRVVSILEQPTPPGGTPSCAWCQYRDTSKRTGL